MTGRTPDNAVERLLSDRIGLDPGSIGRKNITDAVRRLMAAAGVEDAGGYLRALHADPAEMERLVEELVVPETWFFRDAEAFNFLRKHLRDRPGPPDGRPLRLLSAPCSTGEEPYSIAMVLAETGIAEEDFRIDALDISGKALDTARRAIYGKASFREKNTGPERYFNRVSEGRRLDPRLAGLVHFSKENFARPDALAACAPYDIIFCKNLLIYLTEAARKQVLANIGRLLVPGGLLFTGHSEMMFFLRHGYASARHERAFACTGPQAAQGSEEAQAKKKRPDPAGAVRRVPAVPHKAAPGKAAPTYAGGEAAGLKDKRPGGPGLEEIRRLADAGDLEEACRLCGQFCEQHMPQKEAFYLMGLIHLARDAFADAELFFQQALYMDPQYYDALVHMELLYERKGDKTQASIMGQRIKRSQESAAERRETP
jgi:chemotaxis protein methyltransferase WspC